MKKTYSQELSIDLVRKRPGVSAPELAKELKVSRTSAYHYLRSLVKNGKVRAKGHGKSTRYFPHESIYIAEHLQHQAHRSFSVSEISNLKEEIVTRLLDAYDGDISVSDLEQTFEEHTLYIASDDTILRGFEAFIAWCTDPKHSFEDHITEKAIEYIEILRGIDARRRKNGFLDGAPSAIKNLTPYIDIGFDAFYFCETSVLTSGFGRTRTYIELYYGKLNGNRTLLEHAIGPYVDRIRKYIGHSEVDALIFTPPTVQRTVQFRDVLRDLLQIKLPTIQVEKISTLERVLRPQKEIRGKTPEERIRNASMSLEVTIPIELESYRHVAIFDDSFTTGATPNAIALKLRDAGYVGKITVITICGSFSYDLAITEDEI